MANKRKLATYYRNAYAKGKKDANRNGQMFIGRYTEPHGKKYQQRLTNQQVMSDFEREDEKHSTEDNNTGPR